MKGIRAIFFDLDNTLIDRNAAHLRYLEELFDRAAISSDLRPGLRRSIVDYDQHGYCPRKDYAAWIANNYPMLGTADEILEAISTRMPRFVELAEPVAMFLSKLQRSYRLGMVSNGTTKMQRAKIDQAQLSRYFFRNGSETIIISEEVGVAKPDPRVFAMALSQLGVEPGEALFVGDNPENDIAGAAAAGLRTCWIHGIVGGEFPHHIAPPDFKFERVEQLAEALG